MKKIILLFILLLLPNIALAETAVTQHVSKEANFRISTYAPFTKMSINKASLEKNPAWKVRFYTEGEQPDNSALGFFVVDGRKNDDIKQTSADFSNGHAKFILFQIVETEKLNPNSDGLLLKESEVKTFNERNFIFLKYEDSDRTVIVYRIMTAFGNYLYSINCQITSKDWDRENEIVANLDLMMRTLSKY